MTRGFLGGTFDPVHLGHLSLATEALERFSLERVTFVPARFPPHKDPESITLFSHRMAMLQSVVAYMLSRAAAWDLQTAMQWLTGSLNGATWARVVPLAVVCA